MRSVNGGERRCAGDIRRRTENAREGDHLVDHLFAAGRLIARIDGRTKHSGTERRGWMRDVRPDSCLLYTSLDWR